MKTEQFKDWTLIENQSLFTLKLNDSEGEERMTLTEEQLRDLKEFLLTLNTIE
jgi:hypothetical protein